MTIITPKPVSKMIARGYSDVTVTGDAIPHPRAVLGADSAADRGQPMVARDMETGRRVPAHDARSGLDKAAGSLKPVGGQPNGTGRENAADVMQVGDKLTGSGRLPRKAT